MGEVPLVSIRESDLKIIEMEGEDRVLGELEKWKGGWGVKIHGP